jgi:hypothetical protein
MAKAVKAGLIAAAITGIIIASGGGALVAAPAMFGFLAGSTGAAIAFAATMAFVSTGISMMTAKKLPSGLSNNFGTKVSTKDANAPRQIIYGECRVGGTFTQIETSGTDNSVLHLFIVLAGHSINSLEKVFINDKTLTLGSETSSSDISGETVQTVTASFFTNTDNPNNLGSGRLIRFTFHDGTQTAVDGFAQAQLNTTSVPNTHIFKDCAYVYMQMVYDSEKLPNVPNISFQVKGKKLFDPRTSETAFTDSTNKVIGNNPALILRDILTDTSYGVGVTTSEINDTTNAGGFAAAANTCEQTVTLADGSTTEQRYTCNGFTNFASTREDIIAGITSSMAGTMTYSNGKFNAFAGANQTASLTLTDDDALSPIIVTTKSSQGDLYNTVKTMFSDENQKFIPTDTPILQNSTFLSADTPSGESSANFVKTMEVRLPFTTSNTMAQRLGKIALLHQRETTTIRVTTTLKFLQLQPADYVQVTNERLSFSNKLFEVMAVNMVLEGDDNPFIACQLDLKEISTSVYDFATNEYSTIQAEGSDLTSGALTVTAPTAGSINQTATIDGTTTKVNIKVVWSNASNEAIQGTEVQYKLSSDSSYTSQISGKGQTIAVIPNVTVGQTYNVRVRHFTFDNVYSSATDFSNITITQPTDAPNSPSSASVTTGNAFGIRVQWTNPSNTDLRAVKIYRKTNSTTPTDDTNLVQTVFGEPSAISKADFGIQDGLSFGTTYYFWVRAINHGGTHSSGFVSAGNANFTRVDTTDIEDDAIQAAKIDALTITESEIALATISLGSRGKSGTGGATGGTISQDNSITEFNFDLTNFDNDSNPRQYNDGSTTHSMDTVANITINFPIHSGAATKKYAIWCGYNPIGSSSSSSEIRGVLALGDSSSDLDSIVAFRSFTATGTAALGTRVLALLEDIPSNSTRYLRLFGAARSLSNNASGQKGLGPFYIEIVGLST